MIRLLPNPCFNLALLAALVLSAGGCGQAQRQDEAPAPRVRIEGARILEADPEHEVEQGPVPPLLEVEAPPAEEELPALPPLPDVAPGVKVSLDLVDAGATEALRGLAYQGDVDLILASQIDRRVTLHLKEAPWIEAFQAILDGANLMAEWDGSRVRVSTREAFRTEQAAAETHERQFPRTEVFVLQNLLAEDAEETMQSVLSAAGKIGVDEEMNALVVTDTSSRLGAIRGTVTRLDRAPPQVMIEAMIIDVVLSDEMHYGWEWDIGRAVGDSLGWDQALTVGAGTNASTAPGGRISFGLTRKGWSIEGIWDFVETHDNTKVLASPKILAINNRRAQIEIIEEIPYQELTETSEGGQIGTTNFKEVGIKLDVTPRIAADGTVHLILSAEQSTDTGASISDIPVIQTRRASNVMVVENGQTIVIGGLRRRRMVTNEDKVPLMGDIPILGGLFRRSESVEVETELVIFITPHVVPHGKGLTKRERTLVKAIDHPDPRPLLERSDPLRSRVEEEAERSRYLP